MECVVEERKQWCTNKQTCNSMIQEKSSQCHHQQAPQGRVKELNALHSTIKQYEAEGQTGALREIQRWVTKVLQPRASSCKEQESVNKERICSWSPASETFSLIFSDDGAEEFRHLQKQAAYFQRNASNLIRRIFIMQQHIQTPCSTTEHCKRRKEEGDQLKTSISRAAFQFLKRLPKTPNSWEKLRYQPGEAAQKENAAGCWCQRFTGVIGDDFAPYVYVGDYWWSHVATHR